MGSSSGIDSSNKLHVRHSMKTKFVAGLNAILSEEHRCIISKTTFSWFLDVRDNLKVGRNILSDLLMRWVDERGGFLFGDKIVELKEIDVTLTLGLGLVGDKIKLNEKNLLESHCRNYFDQGKDGGKYELVKIYNFVLKNHKKLPCLDVCRLYIFVGIHEILLPSRSRTIFPILFEIVDRINDLGSFCWGRIVYHYLLSSFCKQNLSWNRGKGATNVYVDGCVYVFQVWFCDRFLPSNACVDKYPRILHWMNVSVGDKFIKAAMEKGVMLEDYGASMKELGESYVKASVHGIGQDMTKGIKSNKDQKESGLVVLDQVLEEQYAVIEELEEELYSLKAELLVDDNKDNGGYITPCEEDELYTDFACDGGTYCHESVKKIGQRRKRYKSKACRTPYTGYSPKL